ncbi:MAG: hypothetical protein QM688_07885 [Sphingomonas bacterium]
MMVLLAVVLASTMVLIAIWLFDLERRLSALETTNDDTSTTDRKLFRHRRTD